MAKRTIVRKSQKITVFQRYDKNVFQLLLEEATKKRMVIPDRETWITIVICFKIPKNEYRFHKKTKQYELGIKGQNMLKSRINPTMKPSVREVVDGFFSTFKNFNWMKEENVSHILVMKCYATEDRVTLIVE